MCVCNMCTCGGKCILKCFQRSEKHVECPAVSFLPSPLKTGSLTEVGAKLVASKPRDPLASSLIAAAVTGICQAIPGFYYRS